MSWLHNDPHAHMRPYAAGSARLCARDRARHGVPRAAILLLALALGAIASLTSRTPVVSATAIVLPETDFAYGMLALMNQERVAAGLPEFQFCGERSAVAVLRAVDMAEHEYFAHYNADGIGAEQLLATYPIQFGLLGENLARADYPADQVLGVVHSALMASEHHRDNVLDSRFRQVGIAVAVTGKMYYFAVIFTD